MKDVKVDLGQRSYRIVIDSGLLKDLPSVFSELNRGQKWIVISQESIMKLYGYKLLMDMKEEGYNIDYISLPIGEPAKSFNEYQSIINQMIDLGCDRSTTIISLGGGVVGDVSGFVAATFLRGIKYVQIPTTLLAMVDSSIGGKTGLNILKGKNLVGAIYQPKLVLVDPIFLNSLPKKEVISGIGEIIKYGAIFDAVFLEKISKWLDEIESFPFLDAISRSVEIKAEIVSRDEKESGLRRILNFGHTIGHAIEAHLGYGKIRHGEAIALGMKCSGWISNKLGLLSKYEKETLNNIINKLPIANIGQIQADKLMPYIKRDKKSDRGVLKFVVLSKLGAAKVTTNVSKELIQSSLKVIN